MLFQNPLTEFIYFAKSHSMKADFFKTKTKTAYAAEKVKNLHGFPSVSSR